MSSIIKLICRSKIENCITNELINNSKTSALDAAVQTIFDKLHWSSDIFEGAKKEVIKSVLRDRVHARKATAVATLTYSARFMLNDRKPKTQEEFDLLYSNLQKINPLFDLYEIRYIVKFLDPIQKFFFAGYINNNYVNVHGYTQQPTQTKITTNFNLIHNAAKRELYTSKEYFQEINNDLSEILKVDEAAIDKEIYFNCFKSFPQEGTTPKEIRRALDEVQPGIRKKAYRKLFAHARITRAMEKISSKDALSLLSPTNSKTLNYLSDLTSEMRFLVNSSNSKLDSELNAKLKTKWKAKFPEKQYPKLSKTFDLIDGNNFSQFQSTIDNLQDLLNRAATKFISEVKSNNPQQFQSKDPHDTLQLIQNGYNFKAATLEQVLSASELSSIGYAKKPHNSPINRPKLFSLLHSISSTSAARILNYLKNPTKDSLELLSQQEKGIIFMLFSTISTTAQERDISEEIKVFKENEAEFLNFAPKRINYDPQLDIKIVNQLYQNYKLFFDPTPQNLLLDLYVDSIGKSIESYRLDPSALPALDKLINDDRTIKPYTLSELFQSDTGKEKYPPPVEVLSQAHVQNIINLRLTEGFARELGVNPKIEIGHNGEWQHFPEGKDEFVDDGSTSKVKTPIHIALVKFMKEIAGEDTSFFDLLQTLCSQTCFNHIYEQITVNELKRTLNLNHSDGPFKSLIMVPNEKKRAIKVTNDTIELTTTSDINIRSSIGGQRNFEFDLKIIFKKHGTEWKTTKIEPQMNSKQLTSDDEILSEPEVEYDDATDSDFKNDYENLIGPFSPKAGVRKHTQLAVFDGDKNLIDDDS